MTTVLYRCKSCRRWIAPSEVYAIVDRSAWCSVDCFWKTPPAVGHHTWRKACPATR